MKKLLFALFAVLFLASMPNEALASHAAGGDITYKYIGDSTGIPYHYCITLTVYRRNEPGSAGLGGTMNLSIASSCFGNQSLTMTRVVPTNPAGDGGNQPQNYDACIDVNDPSFFNISEHTYKNCVVLPGKCSDFKFSWSLCCRNANITNLQSPSSQNLYLESTLNNTLGPNTSGQFLNPAAKSFCVNQPFTWSQAATEPDNDSIAYRKGQPWNASNSPIAWAPGYSTPQPMTTLNGFNLNNQTGTFIFTPTQVEVDVLKILVDEFRYDTTFGVWLQIGTAIREMQVPILSQCNAIAQEGITIDTNLTGPGGVPAPTTKMNVDSLREIYDITKIGNDSAFSPGQGWTITMPGIPYDCFDSVITIGFSTKLKCSSFSSDGSEFRVIGPDKVMRPVTSVDTKCGTDLLTDEVDLYLHKPLDSNGSYLLYIKTGNDGDVLENECGFSINPFYAIMVIVENCPILDYKLLNVSVERDEDIRIDWEADPTTFSEKLFTTWNILRANNDDNFYPHDTVNNVYARSYLDTTLGEELVDGSPFQYAVQLVQNFNYNRPTNTGKSILLKADIGSDSASTRFEWTAFDMWDTTNYFAASYQVEQEYYDTAGAVQDPWKIVAGPTAGMQDWTFKWPDLDDNPEEEGIYAFRVKASEPTNANNPFFSESNWLYLKFVRPEIPVYPEPRTGFVPNIITPNGDMQNDLFLLPLNTYSEVSISVYNRWGKLVYQDINVAKEKYLEGGDGWDGTDMNSGNALADGTYFYIIDFKDGPTGESDQLKGNLTIMRGTN